MQPAHAFGPLNEWFAIEAKWRPSADPAFEWEYDAQPETLRVKLNNFPDEPCYTLFAGRERVADFDDWPKSWSR